MRIFIAVRHSTDPAFYYGGLWSGNFYPALRELGHEIVESQVDLLPTSRFMHIAGGFTPQEAECRARTTERILAEVRRAHEEKPIDVFLSYFYNAHFEPARFDELRRLGIPSVNFYCNSIYQFDYVAAIAAKADFSWHAEKHARDSYLKAGANPVWVQMAADPKVYRPLPGTARKPSACFVGQRYADRDRWMAALIRAGIPVSIYGPGWGGETASAAAGQPKPTVSSEYLGRKAAEPRTVSAYMDVMRENFRAHGPAGGFARSWRQYRHRQQTRKLSPLFPPFAKGSIPFQKISDVFGAHELILNFSNVWGDGRPGSPLIPHVRLRDFEAPMCRTCYATGYTDEITEFYEPEREIVTYRSPEELADKTRFYLANPHAAEQVRDAGYRRAVRDHSWGRRFEQLFSAIGLTH